MSTRTFLAGAVAGAGLMYLFDPERGAERRTRLRRRIDAIRAGLDADYLPDAATRWPTTIARRYDDIDGLDAHLQRSGGGPARLRTSSAIMGVAGGALAAYGLARRGNVGRAMRTVGTTMLATGLKQADAAGFGLLRERRQAVDAQRTIEIEAPPARVFDFWRNYDNFSLFLSHVNAVTDLGGDRSRWSVDGPAGLPVTWTASITDLIPGRRIGWKSEPGSAVQQQGTVRFSPTLTGTRVDVRICYMPPAGALGKVIAELFGDDPDRRLDEDLLRVKALLETNRGD